MPDRLMPFPDTYDPRAQRLVGQFAAQLDDQLRRLKASCRELTIAQLEWQLRPGMNTAGMLLAHIAVVEYYWINLAPRDIPLKPDGDDSMLCAIGLRLEHDGMPLPSDGRHPAALAGKTASDYLVFLDAARAATHAALRGWKDADLEETYPVRDFKVSRHWTLYHALEHFSGHFGQILLLFHLQRDAGIMPPAVKS